MRCLSEILAISFCLSGWIVAQDKYNFTTFQNPGASVTRAFGMDNHGAVVGTDDHTPGRHAFLVQHGAYIPLDPNGVLGKHTSFARGMNNRGEIVGGYFDDDGTEHGFIYRDGVVTTLDVPFNGSVGTQADDISPSGIIVGVWVDEAFTAHGFVYNNGIFAHLDYPGALDTYPFGINPQGDIAGNWDTDQSTVGHGFVFHQGQFISIDVPAAVPEGTAVNGINARGQIVGSYIAVDGFGHGFVAKGANFTTLDCPAGDGTTVWAIDSAGQIAGTCNAAGQRLGFVANPASSSKP